MKPDKKEIEYEKVNTKDFVIGTVSEVQRDKEHKTTWKGEERTRDMVRFKFEIEGCNFIHQSRWMTFSYGEKTNLFNKYLVPLVKDAKPDFDFDIEQLVGFKVKMLWQDQDNGFQSIEVIRPFGEKLVPSVVTHTVLEDEPPFDLPSLPEEPPF